MNVAADSTGDIDGEGRSFKSLEATGMLKLPDQPIASERDDLLGRNSLATLIAEEIRGLDATHGAVVGILGPWGVGKTSLLNLVLEHLAEDPDLPTVEFNPWLFSSTEHLVTAFFEEVAAQLRVGKSQRSALADQLEAYGEALSPLRFVPVVGPWLDRAGVVGRLLGKLLKWRTGDHTGVTALRDTISEALAELQMPIVVSLDDLDRLRNDEIREVFKLVRLTGSFPNLVYLLAFDRERVERALTEDGIDGREYLEKILQFTHDVPPVPNEVLQKLFLGGLDEVLSELQTGPFDDQLWPDVFMECIWPLIDNLRDVKRYLASLPVAVKSVGENVALVDLLAAEALRQFVPGAHRRLRLSADALTTPGQSDFGADRPSPSRVVVEQFIASGGEQKEVVRAFCLRLFPAAGRFLNAPNYGA